MSLLRRLPGYRRAPAGLEWAVLRRLPGATLAGTLVAVAAGLFVMAYAGDDPAGDKLVTTTWIVVASALVLHWTAMFTVALACAIVWIAKGPAYVADAYELIDADRPASARQHRPGASAQAHRAGPTAGSADAGRGPS